MLALLVAGAVAVWALGWFDPEPPATETRLTIAVLPFTTQGEDWLGDGIAEDIMTAVSRLRDLTVIARNSSFRYRGEALARIMHDGGRFWQALWRTQVMGPPRQGV